MKTETLHSVQCPFPPHHAAGITRALPPELPRAGVEAAHQWRVWLLERTGPVPVSSAGLVCLPVFLPFVLPPFIQFFHPHCVPGPLGLTEVIHDPQSLVLESSFLASAGTDRAHKTPPVNMSAHQPSTDEERKGSPSFQDGSPPTLKAPQVLPGLPLPRGLKSAAATERQDVSCFVVVAQPMQ